MEQSAGMGSWHPQGFPVLTSPPQAESCTHGLPKEFLFTSCSFPGNVSDSLTGGWAFPLSAKAPYSHHKCPQEPWEQLQLEQVRLFSEATFEDHAPLPGNGSLNFCFVILACLAALSSKTAPGAPRYSVSDTSAALTVGFLSGPHLVISCFHPHHWEFPQQHLG